MRLDDTVVTDTESDTPDSPIIIPETQLDLTIEPMSIHSTQLDVSISDSPALIQNGNITSTPERSASPVVVVSTQSLDPCLWGQSDHPAFGPTASISLHLASSLITPAGSVHKSRGNSVVRMWMQLKRWCVACVWVL